jgi:hypothetical protein
MASLTITKSRATRNRLSQKEIDTIVLAQAEDDSAWEEPVRVHREKPASLRVPAELAARAAFLAKLHRAKRLEEWLTRIIQERIELEEVAFTQAKREIASRNSAQ